MTQKINLHPSAGFTPEQWKKLTPAQMREAMQRRKKPPGRKPEKDALPPHDDAAEIAALSLLWDVDVIKSQAEQDALIHQLRPALFYDLTRRQIYEEICKMRMENHAVDIVTISSWFSAKFPGKENKPLRESVAQMLAAKETASQWNFHEYLSILKDKALRRWLLQRQNNLVEFAHASDLTIEQVRGEFAEILEQSEKIGGGNKPLIEVVSPEEAKSYEADENDFLVGRGLIMRGQVFCIGGAPGVGKSRLGTTLALAGAGREETWMGYPVPSQWRTLIIQTENNGYRLKEECDAIPKKFSDFIRITRELPMGMAFGNPEFRRQLLALFDRWPFQMMLIDPLNDLVMEDGQTDFKMALQNIRQAFIGRKMPAIGFVAHLRKSRGDSSSGTRPKSGRQLLSELSGTLAIGSTARAVFVVQAASSDMADSRVVFEVAKSSDVKPEFFKEYGARTAWHRANGAFEPVEDFDWQAWDNPPETNVARRTVTEEMVREVLKDSEGMKHWQICKAISDEHFGGKAKSTIARALGDGGYLRHLIKPCAKGGFVLKDL